MKKGKSTYQFPINVDPNLAQQVIMNWLGANGFDLKEKDGNHYYQYYDPVIGRRLFEYYIQPGMVTINAYIGKYKKPYLLDDSFAGSVPKSAYKQALAPLFQTLASYNAPMGAAPRSREQAILPHPIMCRPMPAMLPPVPSRRPAAIRIFPMPPANPMKSWPWRVLCCPSSVCCSLCWVLHMAS